MYKKKDITTLNNNLKNNFISSEIESLISKEGVLISGGPGFNLKHTHKF